MQQWLAIAIADLFNRRMHNLSSTHAKLHWTASADTRIGYPDDHFAIDTMRDLVS
jgi:hypothetical protein